MIHREDKGIAWLEFEHLAQVPGLVHGVFLRHGEKIDDSLRCYRANQTHSTNVTIIDEHSPYEIPNTDALITTQEQSALIIRHADCQAAIFYDPDNHAIANVHAGWRGSVGNIYRSVVEAMTHTYGTNPKNLVVGISPSLGPNAAEFCNYQEELPINFWQYQTKPTYFDFW